MGCALALLLALPSAAVATTVQYHTDEELFALADAVIVGHVWRESVSNEGGLIRSRYEIQVQESLKSAGEKVGDYIIVQTLGGSAPEVGGGEYIAGSPHPQPGVDAIMFLKRHRSENGSREDGPDEYSVISMGLGHMEIRYNAQMRRYFTHRDLASLALVRKGTAEVLIPEDQLATEVLEKLRQLKTGGQ